MRHRITVRADNVHLRGYFDGDTNRLTDFSQVMAPVGMVIASVADENYDPFRISQPDSEPTIQASMEIVKGIWDSSETPEDCLTMLASLHYQQAYVIRGERHRAEVAEIVLGEIIERAIAAVDDTTLGSSDFAESIRQSAKSALRQVAVDLVGEAGPPRG